MGAWWIVDCDESVNAIDSTWAFKCKCYPDGLISKARFYERGDQQLEGIDFFETYVPLVQLNKVRLMLVLEVLLGFKSNQGDFFAVFIHADIHENEKFYIEMLRGFEQFSNNGRKKCFKLKNMLYGLLQIPRAF